MHRGKTIIPEQDDQLLNSLLDKDHGTNKNLLDLPDEILSNILSYLDERKDLVPTSRVCTDLLAVVLNFLDPLLLTRLGEKLHRTTVKTFITKLADDYHTPLPHRFMREPNNIVSCHSSGSQLAPNNPNRFSSIQAAGNQVILDVVSHAWMNEIIEYEKSLPPPDLKDILMLKLVCLIACHQPVDNIIPLIKKADLFKDIDQEYFYAGKSWSNSGYNFQYPLLHFATAQGHLALVEWALENGAHLFIQKYHPITYHEFSLHASYHPILIAADIGHVRLVEFFLQKDLSLRDKRGLHALYTPLMLAAQNGHLSVVDCLIKHKADLFAEWNHNTALFYAMAQGHIDCVESLIKAEPKVLCHPCNWYSSPLLCAVRADKGQPIVELFLKQEYVDLVDLYATTTSSGPTAYQYAKDDQVAKMVFNAMIEQYIKKIKHPSLFQSILSWTRGLLKSIFCCFGLGGTEYSKEEKIKAAEALKQYVQDNPTRYLDAEDVYVSDHLQPLLQSDSELKRLYSLAFNRKDFYFTSHASSVLISRRTTLPPVHQQTPNSNITREQTTKKASNDRGYASTNASDNLGLFSSAQTSSTQITQRRVHP